MKLISERFNGENIKDIIYSLEFSIFDISLYTSGFLVVTKSSVLVYLDDKIHREIPLESIEELKLIQNTGAGELRAVINSEEIILCRFKSDVFAYYAELCATVNHYIKTGIIALDVDVKILVCPKCGFPLKGKIKRYCANCLDKGATIKKAIQICIPYKKEFFWIIAFTLIIEAAYIFIPYIQRRLVDDYIVPKYFELNGFLFWVITTILLHIMVTFLETICSKTRNNLSTSLIRDLRVMVFEKLQLLSMATTSKFSTGGLINRITNDTAKIKQFISDNGTQVIIRLFSFITLAIIMLITNYKLAILVLIPVPIVIFLYRKMHRMVMKNYRKVWKNNDIANKILHDVLNGIRVVKSYGKEQSEINRYSKASKRQADSITSADIFWYIFVPINEFILYIGNFLCIYFGAKLVLNQQLMIGELMQYFTYVTMIYVPINWIIHLPRALTETSVSVTKVFEILDEPNEDEDTNEIEEAFINGDLEFRNVNFGYKAYIPVVKDISFTIKQGETIGIVGASGAGKSTLINLIMRLYEINSGEILIDGVNIKNIPTRKLRESQGVVLQESFLFDGSIIDNIRYAKPDADFLEILNAASVANAHDFISKLPEGYNTRVGDRGYMLSGGERQRIAIARAILHNPRILILDEATASLDAKTEKQIQDALDILIKGRTTIAIAHRLSTLRNADRLIVLDKGKICEIGTHIELMKNKSIYFKLVMAQRQTSKIAKAK